MDDLAISVSNVSKCYQVFDNQRSKFLHAVWPSLTKGMQEVWALKDINFQIKRGEAVGIIGRNGGGKSTLLQILTGTLSPTTGDVKVNGRVSALLELGSGFNPEYSGRDNVILNGLLLGLSREQILSRFDEIEAFAEIGTAIDRPVKTYSSGMMMRLAFAVQVLCDPDILIIDEALSVGDFFFQQKCLSYIRTLCHKGVTLLFVSHDMGTVRDLCSRVVYLQKGELFYDGESSSGIQQFFNQKNEISEKKDSSTISFEYNSSINKIKPHSIWTSDLENINGKLFSVSILDKSGVPRMSFKIGEILVVQVMFKPDPRYVNHLSFAVKDKFDALITSTGSLQLNITDEKSDTNIRLFELEISLMVEAGDYSLNINLGHETNPNRGLVLDETGYLGPFSVDWDYENDTAPFLGKVGLPVSGGYKELV